MKYQIRVILDEPTVDAALEELRHLFSFIPEDADADFIWKYLKPRVNDLEIELLEEEEEDGD